MKTTTQEFTVDATTGRLQLNGVNVPVRMLAAGDSNTKMRKNDGQGFLTAGLSLAPWKTAGIGNACTEASPGCIAACLNETGLGAFLKTIQQGRIVRSQLFNANRPLFMDMLRRDIDYFQRKADRAGERLAIRLNVFSDYYWERFGILDEYPHVQFYDYTKHGTRVPIDRTNYHLTFSRSETNHETAIEVLNRGGNVAIPFADMVRPYVGNRSKLQHVPKTWRGFRVIDGDQTDMRFDDPVGRKRGIVVGLRLKAASYAKRTAAIESGFAVKVWPA